jgi:hypothetical protein
VSGKNQLRTSSFRAVGPCAISHCLCWRWCLMDSGRRRTDTGADFTDYLLVAKRVGGWPKSLSTLFSPSRISRSHFNWSRRAIQWPEAVVNVKTLPRAKDNQSTEATCTSLVTMSPSVLAETPTTVREQMVDHLDANCPDIMDLSSSHHLLPFRHSMIGLPHGRRPR